VGRRGSWKQGLVEDYCSRQGKKLLIVDCTIQAPIATPAPPEPSGHSCGTFGHVPCAESVPKLFCALKLRTMLIVQHIAAHLPTLTAPLFCFPKQILYEVRNMALLSHSLRCWFWRHLIVAQSSRAQSSARIAGGREDRARKKFAILVLVEPCAFEVEERNAGEVR
jgi:hypothetical protein